MIAPIITILTVGLLTYLILNSLYRNSLTYKNANPTIKKYKEDIPQNIQLATFGSTYAMHAFDCFDTLKLNAFNFAIEAQSLEMDDRLLRKYTPNIAPGATVIFGLAACVTYYRYNMVLDKSRYYAFLDKSDIPDYSVITALRIHFPLSYSKLKKIAADIIKGQNGENGYSGYTPILPQQMMEDNMKGIVDNWINLFNLKNLKSKDEDPTNLKNKSYNTVLLRAMIDYCLRMGWRPVIVIPPFSDILNQHFGSAFIENSLDDMIKQACKDIDVKVLDYRLNEQFQKDYSSFIDGGFRLNRKGSEKFVKLVIRDLNSNGFHLSNQTIGCRHEYNR